MNKKIFSIGVGFLFLFGVLSIPFVVSAEDNGSEVEELIVSLQEKIEALEARVAELIAQIEKAQEKVDELEAELKLVRQLGFGMSGDDVKLLQEFLATDPDIYPEGLITGYFGRLTERAVQRFQEKAGIDQVGRVGPQTMSRINQIFEEGVKGRGAGLVELEEGVFVPPGLLRAPGIIRLMGKSHPLFESVEVDDKNGDEVENDVEDEEEDEDEDEEEDDNDEGENDEEDENNDND